LDGVLGLLEEVILAYGGGKVIGTEFVHDMIDGGGKAGVQVEEHLLLCCNNLGGVVDLGGGKRAHFDRVSLTICAGDSRERSVNCI